MEQLNAYGIKVEEDIMHNRIRYDPSVHRVPHDRAFNLEELPYNFRENINESTKSTSLEKRWQTRYSLQHVSVKMLNSWDKLQRPSNFNSAVRPNETLLEKNRADSM